MQIHLFYDQLPFYPSALRMYQRGQTTGSNNANRKLAGGLFKKKRALSREEELLFDPQTSGGLLFSLPAAQAEPAIEELRRAGLKTAVRIGEVITAANPEIVIL